MQEVNKTSIGSGTGSDYINTQLLNMFAGEFIQICEQVPLRNPAGVPNGSFAGLSIIYHKNFGDTTNTIIIDNPQQWGRPLLLVSTSEGYTFANFHGAQNPKDAGPAGSKGQFDASIIQLNQQFITENINGFMQAGHLTPDKCFIMGDTNDRYDAIETYNILGAKLGYAGESPYSCCDNWDSSGSSARCHVYTDDPTGRYTYCDNQPQTDPPTIPFKKMPLPEDERRILNYRNKGDKVFGLNPLTKIAIYPTGNPVSIESDHQLVYELFQAPSTGVDMFAGTRGRRRTQKRRSYKRRSNKRKFRKSRK